MVSLVSFNLRSYRTILPLLFIALCSACYTPSFETPTSPTIDVSDHLADNNSIEIATANEIELTELIVSSLENLQRQLKIGFNEDSIDINGMRSLIQDSDSSIEIELAIQKYLDIFRGINPAAAESLSEIQRDLFILTTTLVQQLDLAESNHSNSINKDEKNRFVQQSAELVNLSLRWRDVVGEQINNRKFLYCSANPDPALVAFNRVTAFQQAYEFTDLYQAALSDGIFTISELKEINQLGSNARASFYNTGDYQIFEFARQIDYLVLTACHGDWATSWKIIPDFLHTLPRRPQS
ncbi:MAG: hypothetical protein MUP11_10310 [Anaerolineales bacterium]|nr:hypothetical protein [Anaerolineales bacterium]